MKYPMIIFSFIISVLLSQVPIGYKLSIDKTLNRYENITENGLQSNSIVDIRSIDDSYFLLSTASGLSYVHIYELHPDSINFGSFNRDSVSLPRGGAPALAVLENIIARTVQRERLIFYLSKPMQRLIQATQEVHFISEIK